LIIVDLQLIWCSCADYCAVLSSN